MPQRTKTRENRASTVQRLDVPSLDASCRRAEAGRALAAESASFGPFQIWVVVLCGLAILLDGMDFQVIGYVAPAILKDWHVSARVLGPVFASGMIGMVAGATTLGSLADVVGRRPVLIGSLLVFAASMLLTTQVHTVNGLLWLRFATGVGLGSIMPNAAALAGDFTPERTRTAVVTVASSAFAVGAAGGGLLSAALLPGTGWRSVFLVGGCAPAALALLMLGALPESLHMLAAHGRHEQAARLRARLGSYAAHLQTDSPGPAAARGGRWRVAGLFEDGRARSTVLLWAIYFLNLMTLLFLSSWLPTLLSARGQSMTTAVMAGVVLQLGGALGALMIARQVHRSSFRAVLGPGFMLAALALIATGRPNLPLPLLFAAVAASGATVVGGQQALNALAATLYPSRLRATGIGWAMGVGRTGSVLGPVLGGELIAMHMPSSTLFVLVAIPAALSAVLVALFNPPPPADAAPLDLAGTKAAASSP